MGENFKLRWNDHHSIFFSTAEALCQGDHLTDVTLSCGKREFSAHKLVLSICSTYFNELFTPKPQQKNRPGNQAAIVYLKDVDPRHMELLLNFMYRGEINVGEEELMELLNTAKGLQIRGLSDSTEEEGSSPANDNGAPVDNYRPTTSKPKPAPPKAVKRAKSPVVPQPSTSSDDPSSAPKKIKQETTAPEMETFEDSVPGGEDDYSAQEAVYVEGGEPEEYDLDESSGAGNMFEGELPPPEVSVDISFCQGRIFSFLGSASNSYKWMVVVALSYLRVKQVCSRELRKSIAEPFSQVSSLASLFRRLVGPRGGLYSCHKDQDNEKKPEKSQLETYDIFLDWKTCMPNLP